MHRVAATGLVLLAACRIGFERNSDASTGGGRDGGDGDGGGALSGHVATACLVSPVSGSTFPMGVAVDAQGQPYLFLRFSAQLQVGAETLTNTNRDDAVIIAYDKSCGIRWHRQIFDTANTGGVEGRSGIAVDAAGNVTATAEFGGTIDFGDGPRTAVGTEDVFVVHYDAGGAFKWVHTVGSTLAEQACGLGVRANGDVVAMGNMSNSVDFGGGAKTSGGMQDVYVVEYTSDGALIGGDRFGSVNSDTAYRGAVDPASGAALMTSTFVAQTNLGTGILTSGGGEDLVISRYGTGPVVQLAKRFGDMANEYGFGIAGAQSGDIVVAGEIDGMAELGSGPVMSKGGRDIFVLRVDSNGNPRWLQTYGTTSNEFASSVTVDADDNAVVVGSIGDIVDFGDGPHDATGKSQTYILSLDPQGGLQWAHVYGPGNAQAKNIAKGPGRPIAVMGQISSAVDFDETHLDPGTATSSMFVLVLD